MPERQAGCTLAGAMNDQQRLSEAVEYVALQRPQSRYADVVTSRAPDELAGMARPDCPIVVDVRRRQFEPTSRGPDRNLG